MADEQLGRTDVGAASVHRVVVNPAPPSPGADREPLVSLRGLVLVAAALLLGAVLLPSGTRAPLAADAAGTTGHSVTAGASTGGAGGSGTTPGGSSGSRSASSAGTASSAGRSAAGGSGSSASGALPGPVPSSVHVLVANGSTVNGLAAQVSAALAAKGYVMSTPVVALTALSGTEIWPLDPVGNAAAAGIISVLGLSASALVGPQGGPAPVSAAPGVDVVVVSGPDLAGRFTTSSGG